MWCAHMKHNAEVSYDYTGSGFLVVICWIDWGRWVPCFFSIPSAHSHSLTCFATERTTVSWRSAHWQCKMWLFPDNNSNKVVFLLTLGVFLCSYAVLSGSIPQVFSWCWNRSQRTDNFLSQGPVSLKVCCFSLIHTVVIWEFHLAFSANAVHAGGVDFQSVATDLSMSEAHRKHFPTRRPYGTVQYFDMKISHFAAIFAVEQLLE